MSDIEKQKAFSDGFDAGQNEATAIVQELRAELNGLRAVANPTHTLIAAARALVHEIAESGTHTRWKRLANALETEEERTSLITAQPQEAQVSELADVAEAHFLPEIEALRRALSFYADKRRYQGPNQRPIPDDPFAKPDAVYINDVTRDGGSIATLALSRPHDGGGK